jgi:hypothetical protein
MIPNTILNIAERALREALQNQIYQIIPNLPIYHSDESAVKAEQPYLIIHCEEAVETIGPGTGIYDIPVTVTFRSHVKPTSPDERDAVIAAINNFVYSKPAQVLSQTEGFHCYGFMPITVKMGVNPELKSYEYVNDFKLVAMPTDDIVNGQKVTDSLPH